MPKDMSLLEKDGAPTEEELKEFFRKHDFSSQVSSFDVNTASESENRLYIRATKIFRGSWTDQVYALGGKKTLRNFSKNDPLRCLEDSEEKLVSGTVAEIASDEDLFQSIIDSVFSSFQNELYASALKKKPAAGLPSFFNGNVTEPSSLYLLAAGSVKYHSQPFV